MKKTLSTLLLSCALAAALMAQSVGGPPDSPHQLTFLTAKLGLTAEQQSQAAPIFSNARAAESPLRASMRTARQALKDAVRSNNIVGIEQSAATVGSLTAQLTLAQSKARAAFYQILTPEQRSALDQLESQRSRRFWGGARAGLRTNGQ